jgi:hypothetical protein
VVGLVGLHDQRLAALGDGPPELGEGGRSLHGHLAGGLLGSAERRPGVVERTREQRLGRLLGVSRYLRGVALSIVEDRRDARTDSPSLKCLRFVLVSQLIVLA